MARILLLALALLIVIPLYGQSSTSSPQAQASGNNPDLTSVTGCLQLKLGEYSVAEDDGTVQKLAGSTGKLRHYVGHQVEVTGKLETRTNDSTLPGGSSTVSYKQFLMVKSFKHLADNCN